MLMSQYGEINDIVPNDCSYLCIQYRIDQQQMTILLDDVAIDIERT